VGKSIQELIDQLPTDNLTTATLQSLDFAARNEWRNTVGFANTIKVITGQDDEAFIQQVGERINALYNDPAQPYQIAVWLYQIVDHTDRALSTSSFASRFDEKVPLSNFFNELALKSEEAQSLDLCLKIVTELIALGYLHRVSGNSIAYFAESLGTYSDESLMRMAALVCIDGLLPLGANFISKVNARMSQITPHELRENLTFQKIREMIPGQSEEQKLKFIRQAFASITSWMEQLITTHNLSPEVVGNRLHRIADFADDKLDCLGAFLDAVLNYYEHTGIQTVMRRLVTQATAAV